MFGWGPAIKGVTDLIGEFVEDKDQANKLEGAIKSQLLNLEQDIVKSQRDIIVAEAKSQSWCTSNWRPVTMLTFVGLIVAKWLGYTAPGITPELEMALMEIIKIGLGGYVVGRSGEKMVEAYAKNRN